MSKPPVNPGAAGGYPSRGYRSGNDEGHERGGSGSNYPSRGFGGGHGYRGDGSGSWVGYGRDNDSHDAGSREDEASWGGYGRDRDDPR